MSEERGQTGVRTGLSHVGMFLFGLPFFLVGQYFLLGSLGLRPLDLERANVPEWVLGLVGLVFLMGGLMLWAMGYRAMRFRRRLAAARRAHPDQPAYADFPWDWKGFVPDRWGKVLQALAMLPLVAALIVVMNYMVFVANRGAPLFAQAIVLLFDVFLVFGLYRLGLMVLRAVKYGRTRLRFERFPFRRGETLPVHIELPAAVRRTGGGRIELRQIEEFWEVSGRAGKNRRKSLVHECGWSGERVFEKGEVPVNSGVLETSFAIPAEVPPTRIDAERPIFWELDLRLETPGVDFHQRYLVPVY
ncbi:MAG: hypothetical protein GVY36_08935 [Verrucomicrobia bacterium]|nr:hypothetical protein [Verrucomicrobiota bacterium]